jgi:hypothetical protein
MILQLPDSTTYTEAVAMVMVCQQLPNIQVNAPRSVLQWFEMAGIPLTSQSGVAINFGEATRLMKGSRRFYPELIIESLGLSHSPIESPQFLLKIAPKDNGIVLAPFGPESAVPMSAWRLVVRYLRSYGQDLLLVGEPGERIDLAGFTEAEICSGRSPFSQVHLIQSAALVVGVPNGFTWTAAACNKPSLILMPEDILPSQLFPFNAPNKLSRILAYPREGLEYAALITGLRALISGL